MGFLVMRPEIQLITKTLFGLRRSLRCLQTTNVCLLTETMVTVSIENLTWEAASTLLVQKLLVRRVDTWKEPSTVQTLYTNSLNLISNRFCLILLPIKSIYIYLKDLKILIKSVIHSY